MPIFHHKSTPVNAAPTGLRCQAQGCSSMNALACTYRDRRGRSCRAVFCPDHAVVVDDDLYCRRHGSTMRALGTKGKVRAGLPDVDNRGPSLVQYVSVALDARVTALLRDSAKPHENVIADPEVTKAFDPDRTSRWERSWRLVDDTGVVVKVTAFVPEGKPDTLALRVGSHVVSEGVPPWISRRARGEQATEEQDEASRREFYDELDRTVTAAVRHARDTSDRPAWAL